MGRRGGIVGIAIAYLIATAPASSSAGDGTFPRPAIPYDPAHYLCYRATGSLTIDGRLDESDWAEAVWTAPFVDIEGAAKPMPRFETRAKMLWDDDRFYVAARMEEPHLWGTLTERDAVIYHDNDFEVFIDPDGDTHKYYELEVNVLGTEWDLLLVKPYRDGGPAVSGWDIEGLEAAVYVEGTINDPSDVDRGWQIEIAFPWAALREHAGRVCPPEAGDRWRVNFSRVQWRTAAESGAYQKIVDPSTGKSLPEDNWVWSPQGLVNMHYPEMWGIVQFSPNPVPEGGDRFESDPEGPARWALRNVYYALRAHFMRNGTFTNDLSLLGIEPLGDPEYRWPPTIRVTPSFFEAVLAKNDGSMLHLSYDGRVWAEDRRQ